MTSVVVTGEFDTPADRLWRLVADFGNVDWIPGMAGVRVEGAGPGMIRYLPAGEAAVHERLERIDEAARSIEYTIPVNNPLPVADYRATMQVEDVGSGCRLVWSCTFEAAAGQETEAQQMVRGLYEMMIGWMRDHLRPS